MFKKATNFYLQNERRLLLGSLFITTGTAVLFKAGIRQHDAYLKARNLYDDYYNAV